MDGQGQPKKKQRTLAAQPAAAAHVGVHAAAVAVGMPGVTDAQRTEAGALPRTRLERILLAARQMQQH